MTVAFTVAAMAAAGGYAIRQVLTRNTDLNLPDLSTNQSCGESPSEPAAGPLTETSGGCVHTWSNYLNAGGVAGPVIAANQTVRVTCKIQGFRVADGNTYWYRIGSAPWSDQYYASADALYNNGQQSGSLHGTPMVDEMFLTARSTSRRTSQIAGSGTRPEAPF